VDNPVFNGTGSIETRVTHYSVTPRKHVCLHLQNGSMDQCIYSTLPQT
jgi:hypothetical protein